MLPFLLATIFLAFSLTYLFKRREAAMQVMVFASLPALLLSGFSWPPEAMPDLIRTGAYALPSTAAIAGFLRLNQMGATFHEVYAEWRILWLLCAIYFIPAWLALRQQRKAATCLPVQTAVETYPDDTIVDDTIVDDTIVDDTAADDTAASSVPEESARIKKGVYSEPVEETS